MPLVMVDMMCMVDCKQGDNASWKLGLLTTSLFTFIVSLLLYIPL